MKINPSESIYLDMYTWGLKQIPIAEIEKSCRDVGKIIRQKDYDNYWRGYYKSALRDPKNILKLKNAWGCSSTPEEKLSMPLMSFDTNPFLQGTGVEQRWVPCNAANKPMIKWGNGCMMYEDAKAWPGAKYIAENLRGSQYVVIDCDGDHDDSKLDLDAIFFLYQFSTVTHCLEKRKAVKDYEGYEATQCTIPASFHLTFMTTKLIPTIHCQWAHVDILGNQNNQLRYYKNKRWNGLQPMWLGPEEWYTICRYLMNRR